MLPSLRECWASTAATKQVGGGEGISGAKEEEQPQRARNEEEVQARQAERLATSPRRTEMRHVTEIP
jgi:hypothetical protein